MTQRSIETITGATPQRGTGILRPFPSRSLPNIDPFVFLDTGEPKMLGKHSIYIAPHPHRGVQPVSLLFKGRIEHRDSLGNHRTVESGGIQWLVAGAGALHEEILHGDKDGTFHMAQLWINVPAELKMAPAEHHSVPAERVPEFTSLGDGATIRLYAGDLAGRVGPAPMPTQVLVAHCAIAPGGEVTIPVSRGWSTSFTVVSGSLYVDPSRALHPGDTPVFKDDGDNITVTSIEGGEMLLMCGEPIGEPVTMGGGFVMNTREELAVAMADYRGGRMGQLAPSR